MNWIYLGLNSLDYNETISVLELVEQFDNKLKTLNEDIEYNLVKIKSEYTTYV